MSGDCGVSGPTRTEGRRPRVPAADVRVPHRSTAGRRAAGPRGRVVGRGERQGAPGRAAPTVALAIAPRLTSGAIRRTRARRLQRSAHSRMANGDRDEALSMQSLRASLSAIDHSVEAGAANVTNDGKDGTTSASRVYSSAERQIYPGFSRTHPVVQCVRVLEKRPQTPWFERVVATNGVSGQPALRGPGKAGSSLPSSCRASAPPQRSRRGNNALEEPGERASPSARIALNGTVLTRPARIRP
ncbi:MAG: hypothetical protein JWP97_4353 [Labilithrix sp.]|nr:hypothetical protein [Labilithrix sp.]